MRCAHGSCLSFVTRGEDWYSLFHELAFKDLRLDVAVAGVATAQKL